MQALRDACSSRKPVNGPFPAQVGSHRMAKIFLNQRESQIDARTWQEVLRQRQRSGARAVVDRIFPFEQLPQAFERLEQGQWAKCCST